MHHSISYTVWSFHFNQLILLRVMQENKTRCFFSEHKCSFTSIKHFCEIPTGHPLLGRWAIYKVRDFRPISDNKWETIEHRVICYYGTLTVNRMRSIEPWYFRWPWMTIEGHFGDIAADARSVSNS